MFKFYILLLVFFFPILTLAMSKAPEQPLFFPIFNSSFNDYPNQTIYYEAIPIISQDTNKGLLNMIPIISQHSITGEVQLQILFTFFPYPDSNPNTITNNTRSPYIINIASNKRNLPLPAFHTQHSIYTLTNNSMIKKEQVTAVTTYPITTGTLYLFPEDITNLMLIIRDVENPPNEYHRIQTLLPPKTNSLQIQFKPSTYSLQDLQNLYQNNINNTALREPTANTKISTGIPQFTTLPSPALPRPNNLSIVLDSPQGSKNLVLPAQYTVILNNILQFYFRLL
ncbi:MAG: hypothetical protein ACRCWI_06570 [Brevinema sp.]